MMKDENGRYVYDFILDDYPLDSLLGDVLNNELFNGVMEMVYKENGEEKNGDCLRS